MPTPSYIVSSTTPVPVRRHIEGHSGLPLCGYTNFEGSVRAPRPGESSLQVCVGCQRVLTICPKAAKEAPKPIFTFIEPIDYDKIVIDTLKAKDRLIEDILTPPWVPVTKEQRKAYDRHEPVVVQKEKPEPPKPTYDYEVWFKGSDATFKTTGKQANLKYDSTGTDHRDALINNCKTSQHSKNATYHVIGPDDKGRKTIRTFVINPVVDQFGKTHDNGPVDFVARVRKYKPRYWLLSDEFWVGSYNIKEV